MEQQLKRIQEKLQLILKQYASLQKENSRLKSELEEAHHKVRAQQQMAEELKQQVVILKAGTGDMNEHEKKDFEKRINAYIKEIDRCIALLESN